MSDDLPSAVVQDADCSERVVILNVRVPGRTAHLVVGATRRGGDVGLLPKATRQQLWGARLPPGAARQKARETALELVRVVAIVGGDVVFEAPPRERPEPATTPTTAATMPTRRCLRVHNGRVVVADAPPHEDARPFVEVLSDDAARAALEARGAALAAALAEDAVELRRAEIARLLGKARQRVLRRLRAIGEDLAAVAHADRIAAQATWLVGEAARAPRGATKLVVTDWSSGEAVPMEIALDPSRSAREQVEAMFRRAKRLKVGGRIAEERRAQSEAQAAEIARALEEVTAASSLAALDAAVREAKRSAPRDVTLHVGAAPGAGAARAGAPRRAAFRTFLARSGTKVLVGKGAADNDTLTLKIARPNDLWLHAKARTGAHVIVPVERGQSCPAEDLVDAAHLAAHFSDARDERAVDVQYTPKRHLRKPKGSPVGFVLVDREKVLALRLDAALLRALLEREEL